MLNHLSVYVHLKAFSPMEEVRVPAVVARVGEVRGGSCDAEI